MSSHASVTLRNDIAELVHLEAFVRGFCAQHGISPAELSLVAEECFVNIVEHGSAARIDVSLYPRSDDVAMTIEDDGIAFDPQSAPAFDPTTPMPQRRIGGLGIHLVRSLTEHLQYQRVGNRNRLTLRLARRS